MHCEDLGEMSRWCGGCWSQSPSIAFSGRITQDSRNIQPGDIYVALNGPNYDGHDFVHDAFSKGACGAIVRRAHADQQGALLLVDDPLVALQQLAIAYRATWAGRAIGITGSVGKTTVKELMRSILATTAPVHATAGNYNNHIGVPLTLLGLEKTDQFAVVELGMNQPGEIEPLAAWVQPEWAIMTEIGPAHYAHFNSIEAIVDEKAALLRALPVEGVAVLDKDSPWYKTLEACTEASVIDVSLHKQATVRGFYEGGSHLRVESTEYRLPQPGAHMASNVLKCIALSLHAGITPAQIQKGLQAYKNAPMRWEESHLGGIHWINDAYNANPLSMRAALDAFVEMDAPHRWVVIGCMHELGDLAAEKHAALAAYLDTLDLAGWLVLGPWAKQMEQMSSGIACETHAEALSYLKARMKPGDKVLLKGSRSEAIETVIRLFEREQE